MGVPKSQIMVLCELPSDNFFLAWGVLFTLGVTSLFTLSGTVFYKYYVNPTYEMWEWKSNPKYPKPEKVRDEIRQMLKGALCGTICPALALTTLKTSGHSKAFCNAERGWQYEIISFLVLWLFSDWYEWFYHYLGHRFAFMWEFHRAHHVFFNPTPFAVIADEYVDMMARSAPMLFIPLVVPIDMDLLFLTFAVFFYGYGTFIHWGYETPMLDAHNPIINTPYQHYCHHAVSGRKTTYHTGFFFKIWDQLAGTEWVKACFCARCEQKNGKRTREQFDLIKKTIPDYSILLSPGFWFTRDLFQFDTTANEVKDSKESAKADINPETLVH